MVTLADIGHAPVPRTGRVRACANSLRGNSGDILLKPMFVKAAMYAASVGGVADRRGNTLAAGRGPRKGLRTEEGRWRRVEGGEKKRED